MAHPIPKGMLAAALAGAMLAGCGQPASTPVQQAAPGGDRQVLAQGLEAQLPENFQEVLSALPERIPVEEADKLLVAVDSAQIVKPEKNYSVQQLWAYRGLYSPYYTSSLYGALARARFYRLGRYYFPYTLAGRYYSRAYTPYTTGGIFANPFLINRARYFYPYSWWY